MIEDMTIRKFAMKTQHDYVQRVKEFAVFLGRSSDTASAQDMRRFQLHLASSGAGRPKINATVAALRSFFDVTLGRADLARPLATLRLERKVPVVLSAEEVARLLEAAPSVKYKAALSVAYGAGLRVSEVVALKVSDIDSERMMLRVEQGRAARMAMRCSHPCCLNCCAIGIASAGRKAGCFPVAIRFADDDAPAHARLPCRGPHGRDHQAGDAAHIKQGTTLFSGKGITPTFDARSGGA